MKYGDPKTVIGCIRVSGVKQELGAEVQAQMLNEYCERYGLNLVVIFRERLTGSTEIDERLGFQGALLAAKEHNAGILLFTSRDRISREVFLTKLMEREAKKVGAVVVTVLKGTPDETPQDQFASTVVDAASELEVALLRQRTKRALALKKARGEYVGALPYGYRWEKGRLVPNPYEQTVIAEAKRMHREGMSLQQIAYNLPYLSRRGTKFGKTQVRKMVISGNGALPGDA